MLDRENSIRKGTEKEGHEKSRFILGLANSWYGWNGEGVAGQKEEGEALETDLSPVIKRLWA